MVSLGWPEVALAALNVLQVVALAVIAVWSQRTRREVERINGELQAAVADRHDGRQ